MTYVMCHISPVKSSYIFFYKVVKLFGGGSVINGPTASSFLEEEDLISQRHNLLGGSLIEVVFFVKKSPL